MKNLDDDLLKEFADVTTRIKTEFESIETTAPIRRLGKAKKTFTLMFIACVVAACLVVAPALTGNSEVADLAWTSVPVSLLETDIQEITDICLKTSDTRGNFEVRVIDERANWGFLFASSEDSINLESGFKYALMTCQFNRTNNGFEPFLVQVSKWETLSSNWVSGVAEVENQKVWTWGSKLPENVVKVELETISGLKVQASVNHGFAFAWFPRNPSDNAVQGNTFVTAYFYDSSNQLVKSVEMYRANVQVG